MTQEEFDRLEEGQLLFWADKANFGIEFFVGFIWQPCKEVKLKPVSEPTSIKKCSQDYVRDHYWLKSDEAVSKIAAYAANSLESQFQAFVGAQIKIFEYLNKTNEAIEDKPRIIV